MHRPIQLAALALMVLTLCAVSAPAQSTQPATAPPLTFPKIDRHPPAAKWDFGRVWVLRDFDPKSSDPFQMDFRCRTLSHLDLTRRGAQLLYASFDHRTGWPKAERMPKDFDWKQIMETGKNPGLGVRSLHARGITGRGVGIAIADQTLLVDHQEYAERLRLYEEIGPVMEPSASMHGPAVASFAVGKTVGVAPEADLYFICAAIGGGMASRDFTHLAQAVRRFVQANQQLPPERRIRVISMSIGWDKREPGYEQITAAVNEAAAAGIFVVSSSLEETHGMKFHGLGRSPNADPERPESYGPGLWWTKMMDRFLQGDRLMVPMDSRAAAAPNGPDEYAFYRQGGWSWSIPYIAGLYAMACQVDPAITPERFWKLALQTGTTIDLDRDGKPVRFGPIVNPVGLMEAVEREKGDAGAMTNAQTRMTNQ